MKTSKSTFTRRSFLRNALAAPVGAALVPSLVAQTVEQSKTAATPGSPPLPARQLGRDGPQVSMLIFGGNVPAYSAQYLDLGWSMGIRYFDTASTYGNGNDETKVAQWLAKYPERRKELFLVSKDHPKSPEQLLDMIDLRLKRCGTEYLDLFFIHGINPLEYGESSLTWPKSDTFKTVVEKLKSSGKCRRVGFSCHDDRSAEYLTAAAQGAFIDAIMVKYTPFFTKGDAFDQALDACHKAGIGLIAMKTLRNAADVPKRLPEFDKLGLTTHQALLHAVWSDPRITAVCNRMQNADDMQSSVAAAKGYKTPVKLSHLQLLRATIIASRRSMCTGCPACNESGAASRFAFSDIARYVTYYEQDGNMNARALYHKLPAEHRDASQINLAALRDACHFKTDYPEIMRRAEQYFA